LREKRKKGKKWKEGKLTWIALGELMMLPRPHSKGKGIPRQNIVFVLNPKNSALMEG